MDHLDYGRAICYSGYREGQSPLTVPPSRENVEEDLSILHNDGYKYIRLYDPNIHARYVLETIRDKGYDMKVMVGIDSLNEVNNPGCPFEKQEYSADELLAHRQRNDGEEQKLIELVREFDEQICAVSVGNENTPSWGQHNVLEARLIKHAKAFKELGKPVTFCEGHNEWPLLKSLPEYMDIISVHSYPYHESIPVDKAVDTNKRHLDKIRSLFPDKQVIFTEIGWSSDSENPVFDMIEGKSILRQSSYCHKRYIEEVTKWIEDEKIIAFLFEAFDEPWKGPSRNSSECNFGLYDLKREKKF